jgi:hypothetical protein
MKKLTFMILTLFATSLVSCEEKKGKLGDQWEDVMDEMEDVADEAAEFAEDALEEAEDKLSDEAKRLKKAVEKEVKKNKKK